MPSNRYNLPAGYGASVIKLQQGTTPYKPNNGYLNAAQYLPNASGIQIVALTFSAAPANGSTLQVFDTDVNGVPTSKTFTFTYSGSPGAGIIPLVAGGGTAAQAATATQVALAAQLNTWTVNNTAPGVTQLISKQSGRSVPVPFGGTAATITYAQTPVANNSVLPGGAGPIRAVMPYSSLG